MTTTIYAGRFDFEDGGTYAGGWEDGKAHGHGVCTGPKSMGEFSGLWQFGYEVTGVYIWPSGNCYLGQWMSGKRHGLGIEKKQRWIYKGEWSQGFKGRYGVRMSEISGAKYEGTWANGLQDGYGSETYADGGTYFGQMSQGMRNGYGIRKSVAYGVASRYRSKDVKDSLTSLRSEDGDEKVQRERDRRFDENRGGFVLRAKSDISEEVAAGVTSLILGTNQAVGGGNIMTNALNGLLRRRRNSLTHPQQLFSGGRQQPQQSSVERKPSLRQTIMSKLKKQKSVGDIDEVNTVGGGSNTHLNKLTSSSGRANKKSSFRSTSSNNSVDSRASNRTAPAGLGAVNSLLLGGNYNAAAHSSHHRGGAGGAGGAHMMDDGEHSFISQDEITDINCIEVYMGEWKQDKRTGYGIAERSDGLKYEGEWFNNKKNGYGVTTFKDGTKEEGKYRNNVLTTDKKKSTKVLMLRTNKLRQKIDAAVNASLKAAQIAQQRADIALARAVNARTKAHAAELGAKQALADSEYGRIKAKEVAPDFIQPGELKKSPEIMLDIDRMHQTGGQNYSFQPQILPNLSDPTGSVAAFSQISPGGLSQQQQMHQQHFRNTMNIQTNDPYMRAGSTGPPTLTSIHQQQHHPQQQYMFHSSTPPPSNMPRSAVSSQFYDPNLIIPANQLQHQQQLMHQSQLMDSTKLNNDMMDAHSIAHLQQQQQQQQAHYMPQHQQRHLFQHQNYSFDEQQSPTPGYYDPTNPAANRLSLLQQAQSHSFNMDSSGGSSGGGVLSPQQQQLEFMQQQMYARSLPRRNTLKRSQRLTTDASLDHEDPPTDFPTMSPQQQQKFLAMSTQQQQTFLGLLSSAGSSATGPESSDQHMSRQQQQKHQQQQQSQQQAGININNISPQSLINNDPHLLIMNAAAQAAQAAYRAEMSAPLPPPPPLPRRKSLPSIIKTVRTVSASAAAAAVKEDETAHSAVELHRGKSAAPDFYIIENGIRKRVRERTNSAALAQAAREAERTGQAGGAGVGEPGERHLPRIYNYEDDETIELPKKMVLESITSLNSSPLPSSGASKRVSMPSIPAYLNPKFANKVMSREEANRLSSLRREELRKNEELEKNKILKIRNMLKTDSISMFFKPTLVDCCVQTDDEDYLYWIKDGFLRNRIFLFVILFNISLAIWFLQMLK